MPSLTQRFQQVFTNDRGFRFNGTLQPIEDMKIYADDYFPVRQILRVPPPVQVVPGDMVMDGMGDRYLLGEFDDRPAYQSFRCYPVNKLVDWTREVQKIDPLTEEPIGIGSQLLGRIWVLSEVVSREARGSQIKTSEEVKRVLAGADVQLMDYLDGERVVKLHDALGIKVIEVI